MAAKQTTLKETGEMVAHVVEHMATKEDIERVDKGINRLDDRMGKLDVKIDRTDTKLGKFEGSKIDKQSSWRFVPQPSKNISVSKWWPISEFWCRD
jgi:hypothetical protein